MAHSGLRSCASPSPNPRCGRELRAVLENWVRFAHFECAPDWNILEHSEMGKKLLRRMTGRRSERLGSFRTFAVSLHIPAHFRTSDRDAHRTGHPRHTFSERAPSTTGRLCASARASAHDQAAGASNSTKFFRDCRKCFCALGEARAPRGVGTLRGMRIRRVQGGVACCARRRPERWQ